MSYAARMASFDVAVFIGANFRKMREVAGLTQEQIADLLDTDQSTVSLWETGARMPRLRDLIEKLEAAGLDPRSLFSPPEGNGIDPAIARTVASLRELPEPVREQIAQLAAVLRDMIPRDHDADSAELLRLLGTYDPEARRAVLQSVRIMLQTAPRSAHGIE